MKKKVLLIVSIISIIGAGVGGYIATTTNLLEPMMSVNYQQELYGCPASNRLKKRKFFK